MLCYLRQKKGLTSSGTARMFVKPFLNTTNTRFAPHRRADVAQSKAVSPAPRTRTTPLTEGSCALQAHIPAKNQKHMTSAYLSILQACLKFCPEFLCWSYPGALFN